jgi:hypothetical protein
VTSSCGALRRRRRRERRGVLYMLVLVLVLVLCRGLLYAFAAVSNLLLVPSIEICDSEYCMERSWTRVVFPCLPQALMRTICTRRARTALHWPVQPSLKMRYNRSSTPLCLSPRHSRA